jgi:O-methyltransferase
MKAYTVSQQEELIFDLIEAERRENRYLSLVKKCLLRTVFPDANRDAGGNILPFDPVARREGRLYPTEAYTMVGQLRLEALEQACLTTLINGVEGDFVECGVWRGGCGMLMRAVLRERGENRDVWLFDSFEGAPPPSLPQDAGDTHFQNHDIFAVPLEEVQKNFASLDLLDSHVRFRKGWFRDTLPAAVDLKKIAVLRLDGDLYESTIEPLQYLYNRISFGGYVLVDDYYVLPGCRQAVDDFRRENGIRSPMTAIDWNGIVWKVT